jgi:hypothetical protein
LKQVAGTAATPAARRRGERTIVTVEFDLYSSGLPPGFLASLGWAIAGKVENVLNHDLADLKRSIGG